MSDGVFAIAMTLLVFGIKIPEYAGVSSAQALAAKLAWLWPRIHTYFISFLVLGVYWMSHDAQLRHIRLVDRPLLWLNVCFLMFIALVPFSTDLLTSHHDQRPAVLVYAANLSAAAVLLWLQWWHGCHRHRLVDPDIKPGLVCRVSIQVLTAPVSCLIAVLVSLVNPRASVFVFLLVPISYILTRLVVRCGPE